MWEDIKKGFAYSFGGIIGWRLGNAVFNLFGRVWKLIAAGVAAWFISFNVVPQSVIDDARRDARAEKVKIEKQVEKRVAHRIAHQRAAN